MEYFYHGIVRKHVIVFGTLFNEIYITRRSSIGDDHTIQVPISYGPRDKFLARIQEDPNLERDDAITLPRISFELVDFQYNGRRAISRLNKIYSQNNTQGHSSFNRMWQPVPYDLIFELNVYGKNTEDVLKIIEQIVPNFQPEWSVTVNLIEEYPDYDIDVPVELLSITPNEIYDGDFRERRAVVYTLTFNLKSFLYNRVQEQKVIKVAKANIYTGMNANAEYEQVKVYPGQDANGNATTLANNTVHWNQIDADEDWDYIVTITSYPASTS